MYEAELQELHNAEGQLAQLTNDLARTMSHSELAFRMQEYATELHARRGDVEGLLSRSARTCAHTRTMGCAR